MRGTKAKKRPKLPPRVSGPVQPGTLEWLNQQNYRIRRIIMVAEFDIFDKDGLNQDSGQSPQLVLAEREISPELASFLEDKGFGKGLAALKAARKKDSE